VIQAALYKYIQPHEVTQGSLKYANRAIRTKQDFPEDIHPSVGWLLPVKNGLNGLQGIVCEATDGYGHTSEASSAKCHLGELTQARNTYTKIDRPTPYAHNMLVLLRFSFLD
jgi:hypothetical protein